MNKESSNVTSAPTPVVSVIVPNYNHARFLRQRIDSILGQTFQNFELILLDDCSTDHSREILRCNGGDPRVRIEFNEQNSGSTFKQWNKGVRMARGKYIWIAESDDCADLRFLGRLVSILDEHPEVTFAYSRSWRVLEDDRRDGYQDAYLSGPNSHHWTADFYADGFQHCQDHLLLSNSVPNASAVVFRKETYHKVCGADERLRICGDYKLWAAMSLEGRIAYLAEPLNFFRAHSENVRTRATGTLLDVIEHLHVIQWVLIRIVGDDSLPESIHAGADDFPPDVSSLGQARSCRALADTLKASILMQFPSRRREILRAFQHYRLALDEADFAISPPSRLQFFLHKCRFYYHYFPSDSWRLRLINLIHVIGDPIAGYRRKGWLGRAYKQVRHCLHAFSGQAGFPPKL